MAYHSALAINSKQRSETERAVVESAEALILETVKLLSRNCPPENLQEAAREDLLALRPHLQEALVALEDIQQRRSLTYKERSQHYAFKMLLACREVEGAEH
jgi:hypothetical protein